MVAVVGSGLEYGVEVDGINAKVLQVVEFFHDTHQVATFKAVHGGFAVPGFKVAWFFNFGTPGKAIRKNLIEYGIFYPVGRDI